MARKGFTKEELAEIENLTLHAVNGIEVDESSIERVTTLIAIRLKAMAARLVNQATPTVRKPRTKKPDPLVTGAGPATE